MPTSKPLPDNVFRASVGAVIINGSGKVLAFERSDNLGSWQFPQGGMDENEEPLAAVLREVEEETDLGRESLELLMEYPEWIAYELPEEKRTKGRGQVQKWFLFRLTGPESEINPQKAHSHEFVNWKWTSIPELVGETAPFRRGIYRKLAEKFSMFVG